MKTQKNLLQSELSGAEARSEQTFAEMSGLSLVDFLRVVRVRYRLILGTAFVVVALATTIVYQFVPLYMATAVVMLDERKNNVEDTAAVLSDLPEDDITVQNQVQILTSRELAGRVVDKLRLVQDPEFNPNLAGWSGVLNYLNPRNWWPGNRKTQADAQGIDLVRSETIDNFLTRITVAPVAISTAMKISFESENPQKAALIANGIANAYVEDQLDAKFDATQKATQWLSRRIAELSRQAQAADAAVQEYKAVHNINQGANGVSVVQQQIADINSQLVLARTGLAEKEASYDSLASLARSGHATDSAEVLASPLIATLRAQESDLNRQIADLSTKYGPRHPKMLDLEAQKQNLDSRVAEEVQRIVDSTRSDVGVASAHVASLQASLEQLESQGSTQNKAEVQLTALQSAATSARSMYEAFLGRLNQTQGQAGIQTPDARVISDAEAPGAPSFPKKTLIIGTSIPTGLILGLLLAFGAERLDSGFRTTEQVEQWLGVPVLSTIGEVAGSEKANLNAADLVLDRPMSSFTEAIRGLQLGLLLADIDKKPKVIVVTSSVPNEGKTTLAVSLARMAARGGRKTLIVDGDLRRPSVLKSLGCAQREFGIVELLAEQRSLDECLGLDERSGASILSCVHPPPNPADMLASHAMQQLIARLRTIFDLIIIDSAPILPVNDTKILSSVADAVLFVVRWEQTPREAVVNALRALADVDAPVSGVALSRADTERFRYYNYGYQNYQNYNKYYSS